MCFMLEINMALCPEKNWKVDKWALEGLQCVINCDSVKGDLPKIAWKVARLVWTWVWFSAGREQPREATSAALHPGAYSPAFKMKVLQGIYL